MRKHRAVPVRPSATAAGLHLTFHGMRFEIIDFSRRLYCLPTHVVKVTPRAIEFIISNMGWVRNAGASRTRPQTRYLYDLMRVGYFKSHVIRFITLFLL